MPQLVRNGVVLEEHPTKSECYVRAFELNLVYNYGRKRNSLLPNVKVIDGTSKTTTTCEGDV